MIKGWISPEDLPIYKTRSKHPGSNLKSSKVHTSTNWSNEAQACGALYEQRQPTLWKENGHDGEVRSEFDPSSATSSNVALDKSLNLLSLFPYH